MAHITRFSIDGLAGRKERLSFVLTRDLNVFFGLNGSGKTSLLKILHSALTNDTSELDAVPFTAAEVTVWSDDYQKEYTYSYKKGERQSPTSTNRDFDVIFTRHFEPSVEQVATGVAWEVDPDLEPGAVGRWSHRYLPITRLYSSPGRTEVFPTLAGGARLLVKPSELTEEGLNRFFAESMDRLWATASTEMLSKVRQIQGEGLANILRAIVGAKGGQRSEKDLVLDIDLERAYKRLNAFVKRQKTREALGGFNDFIKKFRRDQRFRDIVTDINFVEESIESAMVPRNELQGLIDDLFSGPKSVRFQDGSISVKDSDGTELGLAVLSSGEKQAVKIFVEALMAKGNCILIDEPELSLHIDWQRKLLRSILQLNKGGQLIVATHSPEIMADVKDANIFEL